MLLSTEQCLTAIEHHTRALAAAAGPDLDAPIEHCPGWSMADLVRHLIGVHRYWSRIARDLPREEPADEADDDLGVEHLDGPELIAELLTGAEAMIAVLRSADQDAACWTWGLDQNVRFITRHQVQEAAVHHWDAVNAASDAEPWAIDLLVALDAVDELMTHSLPNTRWPAPSGTALGGSITFTTPGPEGGTWTWRIQDGAQPGTLVHRFGAAPAEWRSAVDELRGEGSAADLLLWFYDRIPTPCSNRQWAGDLAVLDRFRALTTEG